MVLNREKFKAIKERCANNATTKSDVELLIREIQSLCPIGNLDAISSLRTENAYLSEVIKEKDEEIKSLVDDIQKIRTIIKDY